MDIEELLNPVVKSCACTLLLTQVDALLVSLVQAISEGVTLEYLLEVLNSEPVRFLFGIGEPVTFAIGVEVILASLEFELVCPECFPSGTLVLEILPSLDDFQSFAFFGLLTH